ncbi:hypothetical protein U0C82_01250 [Fulvimarina sp. 2208YS6-2-32]|uniref:Uncharacterized protein n=1 Tax=Fulvimarina uroteuthidis TaxID=3098149 RepID=A0ABU5HY14_9HYPH|nr:hypothetical protein [Fulvimarina sp. 2208YS6-2-32]MDY8107772.1 hypothetical protein [Fulvimarina sp. 2208YS6-2-32]
MIKDSTLLEKQVDRVVLRHLSALDDLHDDVVTEAAPLSFNDWHEAFQGEQARKHITGFKSPILRDLAAFAFARKQADADNFVNSPAPNTASVRKAQSPAAHGVATPSKALIQAPRSRTPLDKGPNTSDKSPNTSLPTPQTTPSQAPSTTTPMTPNATAGRVRRGSKHYADEYKISEWREAMSGHVYRVDLRLSTETLAKIDALIARDGDKAEPLQWLQRRFARWIKPALGYTPASIWAGGIKSKSGDAFHAHVWISIEDTEHLRTVRHAMHNAAGRSKDKAFARRQVDIEPIVEAKARGRDWYLAKNAAEARAAGVPGKLIVTSGAIKSAATTTKKAKIQSIRNNHESTRLVKNDKPTKNTSDTETNPLVTDSGLTHRSRAGTSDPRGKTNETPEHSRHEGPGRRACRGGIHERARHRSRRGSERHAHRPGRDRRRLDRPGRSARGRSRLTTMTSATGPP